MAAATVSASSAIATQGSLTVQGAVSLTQQLQLTGAGLYSSGSVNIGPTNYGNQSPTTLYVTGNMTVTGEAWIGSLYEISDSTTKDVLGDETSSRDVIMGLRVVRYRHKNRFLQSIGGGPPVDRVGVVAQDVQSVWPAGVRRVQTRSVLGDDPDPVLTIRTLDLLYHSIAMIQQLDKRVKYLEAHCCECGTNRP